jgi:predicted Zn-dependent protease
MLVFKKIYKIIDFAKYILLAVIFLISLAIIADEKPKIELPELGDRVSGAVSEYQEQLIGNQFLSQIYAQAPLVTDPLTFEYTELLIYKLSETSNVKNRDFKVLIIDDNSLNAFAAPGGIIGVNRGLFLYAETEGQFASVMAHELAHLSQRHFARNVLRSKDTNLASALVMISSIAVALISNNPNAIAAGPALLQQQSLRYSRLFEKEADRVGFQNLINAGYKPSSMGEMFEIMNDMRRLYGELPPEFLLTHPITSSRVSDAFSAADQYPELENQKSDSLDYSLIRTRLMVEAEQIPQNSIRFFKAKSEDQANDDVALYGLSLAQKKIGDFSESLKNINKLISKYPKNLILNTTKAEILFESSDPIAALNLTNAFLEISPKNYPLSLLKATILSSNKRYIESEEIIRDLLLRKNDDPNLWLLLSEIQRDGKNIVGFYQSKAEYFILLGQYEEALSQLEFALKLTKNNFQANERILTKIIDTQKKLNKSRGL